MREVYESDFSFGGQRVRQIHRTRTEAEVAERQGKALDLARRIEEWTPGKKSILYLKAWRDGDARILENMLLAMEVVRQPTDRDVLLEIIWCAKGNGTDAAVSIKCIGLRIGRSQETVKAARTRLERKRFISYNEGGGGHTCIYTVHLDRLASQRPIPIAQDTVPLVNCSTQEPQPAELPLAHMFRASLKSMSRKTYMPVRLHPAPARSKNLEPNGASDR